MKLDMEENHLEKLYSSKNILVSYIHNKRLDTIVNLIPKKAGLKILDAGCGEGQLLERISKSFERKGLSVELFGSDITNVALNNAKKRSNSKFFLEDLEKLHYLDESFDIIICTEVIEHVQNYKKVINELKRVLKSGGILIISFPNEQLWNISRFFLGRKPIKVPDHVNSFSPRDIINEVKLKVIKILNIPFGLPYFIALTRIIIFQKQDID